MKPRALLTTFVAVALLLASAVPAAAAKPGKPIKCQIDYVFNWAEFLYEGEVTDCVFEEAEAISFVIEARFPGSTTPEDPTTWKTEHWFGATILSHHGGTIVIAEHGVWNLNDRSDGACDFDECLKYRANGQVVAELTVGEETFYTTGHDELIGARTHGMGYTSLFPVLPGTDFFAQQSLRFN